MKKSLNNSQIKRVGPAGKAVVLWPSHFFPKQIFLSRKWSIGSSQSRTSKIKILLIYDKDSREMRIFKVNENFRLLKTIPYEKYI